MTVQVTTTWGDLPFHAGATNELYDVCEFLARWNDPSLRLTNQTVLLSTHGNLNSTGTPDDFSAAELTPHESVQRDGITDNWLQALEEGIRSLVPSLIERFRCVTYSSCQGHRYLGLDLPPDVREIAILPRTVEEANQLTHELTTLVSTIELPAQCAIAIDIFREELRSITDGSLWASIALRFTKLPDSTWDEYFDQVNNVTLQLETAISSTPPANGSIPKLEHDNPQNPTISSNNALSRAIGGGFSNTRTHFTIPIQNSESL